MGLFEKTKYFWKKSENIFGKNLTMATNKYFELKARIKGEIINSHGSYKNFIDENPNLGFSESNLCHRLGPHTDVKLGTLEPILQVLKLQLVLARV